MEISMKKKILAFIMALMLIGVSVSTVYAKNYHEDNIEEYVVKQMIAAKIPGMSMSIVSSGHEVYSASFGDVQKTTSDMEIGGLSKNFTAMAVMQLCESGIVEPDKKVVEYLPEYSQLGDVTIKELLNQTSGITPEQYLGELSSQNGRGKFIDANGNYNLLGRVIEKVTGKSYSEYMSENVFKPLGMKSTYTIDSADADTSEFIEGHSNYFGQPVKKHSGMSVSDGWIESPSMGIVSDVKDLGIYLQMYLNAGGKVLEYDSIKEMLSKEDGVTGGESIFGTDSTYKMGWNHTNKDGVDVYYCNSAIDGYASSMILIPSNDVAVTMLFDSSDIVAGDKLTEKISAGVACLLIGQKTKPIDANKYLIPHIEVDLIYLLVLICAFIPMFTIGAWFKLTKNKRSILKVIVDCIIHIGIPTAAIVIIPRIVNSWSMLRKFMPDAFYVIIVAICALYAGGIVKLILRLFIGQRGEAEDSSDDSNIDDAYSDSEDIIHDNEAEEENESDINSDEGDTKEIPYIKNQVEKDMDKSAEISNDTALNDNEGISDASDGENVNDSYEKLEEGSYEKLENDSYEKIEDNSYEKLEDDSYEKTEEGNDENVDRDTEIVIHNLKEDDENYKKPKKIILEPSDD